MLYSGLFQRKYVVLWGILSNRIICFAELLCKLCFDINAFISVNKNIYPCQIRYRGNENARILEAARFYISRHGFFTLFRRKTDFPKIFAALTLFLQLFLCPFFGSERRISSGKAKIFQLFTDRFR